MAGGLQAAIVGRCGRERCVVRRSAGQWKTWVVKAKLAGLQCCGNCNFYVDDVEAGYMGVASPQIFGVELGANFWCGKF